MISTTVRERLDLAEQTFAIFDEEGDRLRTALAKPLGDEGAGTAAAVLLGLRDLLERRQRKLAAEADVQASIDDDPAAQRATRAARALREGLVELRVMLGWGFETPMDSDVFQRATPDDPRALEAFADEVLKRFEGHVLTMPAKARIAGAAFDARDIATRLRNRKRRMSDALAEVAKLRRKAQEARRVRLRAIEGFDVAHASFTSVLASLADIAGDGALATEVRRLREPGPSRAGRSASRDRAGARSARRERQARDRVTPRFVPSEARSARGGGPLPIAARFPKAAKALQTAREWVRSPWKQGAAALPMNLRPSRNGGSPLTRPRRTSGVGSPRFTLAGWTGPGSRKS
ncbi:MAG: hypothetical protein ACFCGT_14770 [Sandaracinaceae bacterium]